MEENKNKYKTTGEQRLYVLLSYKKDRTKEEERIISILENKAELGKKNLQDADNECCQQGWLKCVHVVEELDYTTKSFHRMELSKSGLSQISNLWRESKYNPKKIWESRLKTWTPIISAIVIILANIDRLWPTICKIISFLCRTINP